MKTLASTALQWLHQGMPLVLAKITSQQGSTPRTAGTQMIIGADGRYAGTIGGGLLEAKVIAQSRALLPSGQARFERFDLGHADVASMDMICGGGLEILLDPIAPLPENIALLAQWDRMLTQSTEGALVIAIRRVGQEIAQIHHALIRDDGSVEGYLPLTPTAVADLVRAGRKARAMTSIESENYFLILEPIHRPESAYILGAGHVAQPTAHMAALLGFQVIVLDDRADFANRDRFPDAHQVRVLANFENPFAGFEVDQSSYIVIVTRGHLYDKVVLAQALRTKAGYIGMIGSRRKRDAIFHRLRNEGFGEEDLRRVHAPIGLNIGAETPEEIAVSIVGEMVAVRRSGKSKVKSLK